MSFTKQSGEHCRVLHSNAVIDSISMLSFVSFQRHLMNNDSNDGLTDGPASALFIYNPHRRYEVWRFFTYIFVHAEVLHISMNLIVQIFLGFILELRHGWWRVAIVYVAGVLAASMGKSIMEPHDCLRGASGGVYAIILAHIGTTIMVI